jgi:hypothetical protein
LLEKLEPEKLTFTTSPFVLEKETEEREMASTNNTLNSNISGEAGTRIIAARITKTALLSRWKKRGGVGVLASGIRPADLVEVVTRGREIVCGHTGPGTDGWGLSLFTYIGSSQPMKVTVLTSVNSP